MKVKFFCNECWSVFEYEDWEEPEICEMCGAPSPVPCKERFEVHKYKNLGTTAKASCVYNYKDDAYFNARHLAKVTGDTIMVKHIVTSSDSHETYLYENMQNFVGRNDIDD